MTENINDHGRTEVRPWSVSQSATWGQCPRQWWYQHEAKVSPAQPRPARQVIGSAIHAGLEAAYTTVKTRTKGMASSEHARPSMNDVAAFPALAAFSAYWTEHGTGIRDYERDDAERLLLEVLAVLPAPVPDAVLGVEQRFSLPVLTANRAVVNGVMDLVLHSGPDWIHVRDWKLGQVPTKPVELVDNMQLSTYSAAVRQRWPWVRRVTVGLYSIRQNREITAELGVESGTFALQRLAFDCDEASEAARERLVPPRSGEHCESCRFRSYCPAMTGHRPTVLPGVDVRSIRLDLAQRLR